VASTLKFARIVQEMAGIPSNTTTATIFFEKLRERKLT
jgi:hypothetical protein